MPLTTDATTPIVQTGIGSLPTKIQQDYQNYFNTTKPGSYTDVAGGVLYRAPMDTTSQDSQGRPVNQNRAIYYTPDGRQYTLTDKTDLNAIAYTVPEIAAAWKKDYNFTPTGQAPATGVMSTDNWNPILGSYSDANRDLYATNKDVIFDPQLRAVDLTGYKNSRQGAFEKSAMDVYGGKNMTMQDISRLNDAVGGVGAYIPDPENPGKYKLTYADDISKSPYAPKNTPTGGYSFDQLVSLQNNGQSTGTTQQAYSPLSVVGKMNTDAQAEKAPTVDVNELYKKFGVADAKATPTSEGILSGFKYAKDSGISEASLKKSLGADVYNTYQKGFADYAKTGIANTLSDGKLSFDEARESVKFGRDYGYDAQKLADLTGTNKAVFDAIFKSYDDTTNTIVDTVLGADDVKTDGDKIIKALTLQKQYGFTDDDLAKATDFTPAQVKSQLDPMRNFESDYNKLRADPKLTDDQIKTFLTTSMQNPAIKQQLGSQLQPVLDELNKPPQERILGQIEQQRNVLGGGYYQGVFGDPKVMSKILADKGVKSLADLGEKEKFRTATAEVQYASPYGPVTKFDDGTFGYIDNSGYETGKIIRLSPDEMQATYGRYATDGNGETKFTPLREEELATLKDGQFTESLGSVVINKRTGEELTDTTHELAFQSSSGGLNEKKNFLTVQFAKDGTPMLVASKQKAGLGAALQDAMPLIAMALPFVLPGIGAAISGALPGAAVAASGATAAIAPTLLNQALTQGIISGGLTKLSGGQFEKGFLSGAISPAISSGIGSLLPAGMDPNMSRAITRAGTGVVKGALQGGDFNDLLGQGVLSGLTNYGLGEVGKGLNLTPQQLNFATGIALPLAQGQKVNPVKLATTLAGATR